MKEKPSDFWDCVGCGFFLLLAAGAFAIARFACYQWKP